MTAPAVALLLLFTAQASGPAPSIPKRARALIPRLERALTENIAGFWYPRSLDRKYGGYIIAFDPKGEPKREYTKGLVTQARTLWLFARLARGGFKGPGWGNREMLEAADWGYRFLSEKMWDHEHGGFYWEVDATGDRRLRPRKMIYGQAFALYALSEYYLAGRRKEALDFAEQFFRLLDAKAHDRTYGGYIEAFEEDWTPLPDGETTYMRPAGLKTMNSHLHLMEAMTVFAEASELEKARERLLELITIESNTVVRKDAGACTDKYTRQWEPLMDGDNARVSPGHDVENIWLLMEANRAAGIPDHPLHDLYRALFAHALKFGNDEYRGGFYESGLPGQLADRRDKIWWVQAEALVAALRMFDVTGDPKYFEVFEKTWEFVDQHQIDWKGGEWHAIVTPDGPADVEKGHLWKAGYHNGRALIECLKVLRKVAEEP